MVSSYKFVIKNNRSDINLKIKITNATFLIDWLVEYMPGQDLNLLNYSIQRTW